jgi:hypothetical protein
MLNFGSLVGWNLAGAGDLVSAIGVHENYGGGVVGPVYYHGSFSLFMFHWISLVLQWGLGGALHILYNAYLLK